MYKTLSILIVGLLLLGCAGPADTAPSDGAAPPSGAQPSQPDTSQPPAESVPPTEVLPPADGSEQPPPDTADAQDSSDTVLMLGRSVAGAWMEYLGMDYVCQDEMCNVGTLEGTYQGYNFIYSELDIPPAVATSAEDRMDSYGDRADTVFFKLCFADFESDPYGDNLARNKAYVQDVYEAAVTERGKKLIIGNALPMVAEYTDEDLVSNHRAYNSWLDDFAASHDDVQVLDLYGMVSDSSGNLRSDYAYDQYDSHLNDAAYAKITPEFMELLE